MSKRRPVLLLAGLITVTLVAIGCGKGSGMSGSTASTTHTAASRQQPTSVTATAGTNSSLVTGSLNGVTATLHAGTHHPKVGRPWPIHFTVTHTGTPAHAGVSYEYLFASEVVAHRSHYTFTGHFADVFVWPRSAVGYPLTFRAVIASAGTTINLDYPVQVTE